MKSLRKHDFNTMMFLFKTSLFLGRCQELFYEDRHYHEHCFRCFRCDRSLADEPFTSQDEALLCNDCYCNEFSSKCVACDKIVMPGEGSRQRFWLFKEPFHSGFRYSKGRGSALDKLMLNISCCISFYFRTNKDKQISWCERIVLPWWWWYNKMRSFI